ncbi:hypothetical protein NL108_014459 [Boleophthalmus pectinirostris]|nr:hypothetical protein NL108_014459 [Boleophthalmus pectinirostris]
MTIVLANLVLLSVVLYRLVRSSRVFNWEANGKLLVRLVFLLVFFLLFGLTNGLRVGAIRATKMCGLYYAFAVFDSLQGLWILVFGPLYDSKILLMCKCRK